MLDIQNQNSNAYITIPKIVLFSVEFPSISVKFSSSLAYRLLTSSWFSLRLLATSPLTKFHRNALKKTSVGISFHGFQPHVKLMAWMISEAFWVHIGRKAINRPVPSLELHRVLGTFDAAE